MRHHRKRCLRCGADLPAPQQAGARSRPRRLLAQWRVIAAGGAVVVCIVLIVVTLGRRPAPGPAFQPLTDRPSAISPEPGPSSASPASPVAPALPDPDFLGRTAYRSGDYQAALDRYRDAIARNPNDAESLSNYGQALVRLGRTAEALSYFERAIALNERRWAYHFNLAHACGLLEQWDRSVAEYQAAADLFPDDHVTEYNLGMALHKRGDESAAVDHFRRAIELAPDEADFQLSLGISSERLGRASDAVDAYNRYLELAPASPQAERVRARIEALAKAAAAPKPPPPPSTSAPEKPIR